MLFVVHKQNTHTHTHTYLCVSGLYALNALLSRHDENLKRVFDAGAAAVLVQMMRTFWKDLDVLDGAVTAVYKCVRPPCMSFLFLSHSLSLSLSRARSLSAHDARARPSFPPAPVLSLPNHPALKARTHARTHRTALHLT